MAANPIDLTTVAAVEAYLSIASAGPVDSLIQLLITSASQYWLDRTGLDSLNSEASYTERYDGSGSRRQFVRNRPIASVSSLTINGWAVPPSPDYVQPGFVIDQRRLSLAIIGCVTGAFIGGVDRFLEGIQNVAISYTAGYAAVPFDVADKCAQMVAINYKRAGWIDQASQQLQQAGTVSYRSWEIPPEVERVIQIYARNALV